MYIHFKFQVNISCVQINSGSQNFYTNLQLYIFLFYFTMYKNYILYQGNFVSEFTSKEKEKNSKEMVLMHYQKRIEMFDLKINNHA